jgi:ATP-dependent DNA ligase
VRHAHCSTDGALKPEPSLRYGIAQAHGYLRWWRDRRRDRLLHRGYGSSRAAVLCAFDLLELDGEDLRREPIETRKSTLKSLLRGKHAGVAFNAHFIADGAIVYRQACALGCEGIVSKRLGSPYRSGPPIAG